MTLEFRLLPARYAVARLEPSAAIPEWALHGRFFSVTRTAEELSIVCEEANVPDDDNTVSRGWRCLVARGPFAFSLVGIAAEFTAVLARAGVSVLVISTYDTDCVLVPADQADRATSALCAAGHGVS